MNAILVYVDAELEEIVPNFLNNRNKDISLLEEALLKKEFQTVATIGHKMRGTSGGYGFEELTRIGDELEKRALAKDSSAIQKSLDELRDYLARLEVKFK